MTGKKRSASSSRWLQEHFSDKYVQQAQKKGLRSRAWFKLDEIQQSDKLFKPGMTVVDSVRHLADGPSMRLRRSAERAESSHATFYQWIPSSVSTSFRATFVMN